MAQILVVNDWFANRVIQKTIQTFTVENIEFEIMALTQSMIDEVKSRDTHKEMLSLAADSGIVFNGTRAIASKDLTVDDITALWGDESLDIDCDPCIRARVGEKVCEISGLGEYIEEVNVLEIEMAEEAEAAAKKAAEEAEAKAEKERVFQLGEHEVTGSTQLENLPATDDVYLDAESLEEEAAANADY